MAAVAALALRQYFSRGAILGSKQGCRAITDIVMGHTFHINKSQRQHGLDLLQCLNLCLLVHAEHDGVIRRSQVWTHTVLHLIHKTGIVGDLAMAVAMGLQVEQGEPSMDGGLGNAGVGGQGADAII